MMLDLNMKGFKHIEYKNIFHLTFSMNFTCNLSIPNYVGLGKGVSVRFGIVKQLNVPEAFNAPEASLLRNKNVRNSSLDQNRNMNI